jgi:cytochrome d ubiquinol oxidase subunit I
MDALAVNLARLQFAFTISVHIVFPALSIGLASYLAVLEGLWLLTGRAVYLAIFNFWKRIFALSFGMGVVSGVVLSYEFGTNWSVFADKAGPIVGPLMGYEVLTAFFLEAGFLGIMLFGMDRVGRRLHFLATCLVAVGTLFSAFWILAANSWMQTPTGYTVNTAGQFAPADWWAIVFNPSFPYRFVHMVLAAYLTTVFAVGGAGALHLWRDSRNEAARVMFSMAMWMAAVVAPIQVVAGDLHGLNTLKYQPAKIAALEGHFATQTQAPLLLIGWPDMQREETRFALEIPKLGSLILTHRWDGIVPGLKDWPREERPNATLIFFTFRLMVGLGVLMAALGLWGLFERVRRRLYAARALLAASVAMSPAGFIALLAGWITTECGRQPYTVYGLLSTAASASPIDAPAVAASLAGFFVVYVAVFGAGIYYMLSLVRRRPDDASVEPALPVRAAGITPAPAIAAARPARR